MAANESGDRQRETSEDACPGVRNNVRGSSVESLIQAGRVDGDVNITLPKGANQEVTVRCTDTAPRQGDEPSEGWLDRRLDELAEYLKDIVRQRSPLLIWSAFALSADSVVVGSVEYIFGVQGPGEPASEDLGTVQSGLVFAAMFAVVLLWRDVARRHGSDKWKSLREVHPQLVLLFSSEVLLWGLVAGTVAVAALEVPDLLNSTGSVSVGAHRLNIGEFGSSLMVILTSLEIACFLAISRSRERVQPCSQ